MGALFSLFGGLGLVSKLIAIGSLVLVLATAYGVWHHRIYMKGWSAAIAAIAAEDEGAITEAKAKRNVYRTCRSNGGKWDQELGECSR